MKMKFDDDEPSDWEAIKEIGGGILIVVIVVATGYLALFLK